MDYIYLIEDKCNKHITTKSYCDGLSFGFLYILCYHINTESKYPFLQFMLEKTPFCNGIIEEQFTLPSIMITDTTGTLEELVIDKISSSLKSIGCDVTNVVKSMYSGIINDENDKNYALVNITGLDINYLKIYRKNTIWFGLPSEIMNTCYICGIPIDVELTKLFCNMPELSLINKTNTTDFFIIPEAVYSGGEHKDVEFNSIFGMRKKKIYDSCSEYFYFFRNFKHAIKEGGWVKEGGTQLIDMSNIEITHSKSNRMLVDNEYGRYIKGGINRYALFVEKNKLHFGDIPITDELMNNIDCLIIANASTCIIKPDILVKEYELFFPISFHDLNKTLISKMYDESIHYMIS